MPGMSVQAFGGYIEGLIDRHSLTLADVMDAAGVRQNYLWKLINGKIKEPGAATVLNLVSAAQGDIGQALELLVDPEATEESGRNAATKPIFRLSPHHRSLIASMPDGELEFLLEYRERLRRQQETGQ